jgi:hypothetical protein
MNGCPATEIDDHRRWAAAGYPAVAPQNLLDSDIAFIFNEAQQSYWGQGLWLGFIKPQSGMPGGARMCLFSSFGSPSSGALPETFPTGSPVEDKIFSCKMEPPPRPARLCISCARSWPLHGEERKGGQKPRRDSCGLECTGRKACICIGCIALSEF